MLIFLKFLLSGLLVVSVGIIAHHFGGKLAGITAMFPIIACLSLIFTHLENDSIVLKDLSFYMGIGSLGVLLFSFSMYFLMDHMSFIPSIIISILIWGIFSAIIYFLV